MIKLINTFIIVLFVSLSCEVSDKESSIQLSRGESIDGIRIAWDFSSIQRIADKGGYPRLLRLQDSSVIIVYEDREGNFKYKRSYDEGISWSDPVTAFSRFEYTGKNGKSVMVNIANSEIIQLKNGDIIIGCNYRPAEAEVAPYSIAIRRSTDNGETWTEPQILYDAAPRFHDGCWEPSFLQLPDGELQVYFANENAYQKSDEQEISMLNSSDNGITWTKIPKTVSFRKDRRDGMPVSRLINDEIVAVIEDNNIDRFKPYTVRTKISDNWSAPVLGDSPQREYALTERIADSAYLGAPYLLKLPTGETVISYQTNENRDPDWELSTMEVAIGDKTARNFGKRTQPFDVPLGKEAKWNSLALWNNHTVVAVSSTNFASEHPAPYIIKGYIIPEIINTSKDANSYPIFIGSKGETNLRADISDNQESLTIKCKVKDSQLYQEDAANRKSDGVYIYIDAGNSLSEKLNGNVYRLWSDYKGVFKLWKYNKESWETISGDVVEVTSVITEDGYDLVLNFPKQNFTQLHNKDIRLNIELSAYNGKDSGYTETVANSDISETGSWLKVNLK